MKTWRGWVARFDDRHPPRPAVSDSVPLLSTTPTRSLRRGGVRRAGAPAGGVLAWASAGELGADDNRVTQPRQLSLQELLDIQVTSVAERSFGGRLQWEF